MSNDLQELPISNYKDQIVAAVDSNQVVLVTAETGAGKSTQVPQYLAEHGYTKVIVTQPRILAARNLSRRVREEWALRNSEDSEPLIGYRTAHERDDSPDNKILYCTDGLQLVRELTGSGIHKGQVLVLDEVHEWNENMEVLLAWAKKRAEAEPKFKILIMSATIDSAPLAGYFGTEAVIEVPGRSFPVEKRRGSSVVGELLSQLESPGANSLVFLPGKAEIEAVREAIKEKAHEARVPVISLHAQLTLDEQQLAFGEYDNGKIVLSTNIAQTSVTIPDIDRVIDSGLERRSEVRSGVEGLFIAEVSKADCLQRAGRAGRTKSGEYVLAPFDDMPCSPLDERPDYGVPEILRKHIDRLTLRLASIGIDIEELDFYHDPSKSAIKRAKQTLRALGALTAAGKVTEIGRKMERFPVESSYGRMLVEAETLPKSTQAKLATIIAIQEVGGIIKGGTRFRGWRRLTTQKSSDLIAQYDVWLSLPALALEQREDMGIIIKNIKKAEEVAGRLIRELGLPDDEHSTPDSRESKDISRVIVAGQVHQLWLVRDGQATHLATGKTRQLSNSTVVLGAELVAGTPFDLEVPTKKGDLETLHLVQGLTRVEPAWLADLSPHVTGVKPAGVRYDPELGRLVEVSSLRLKGRRIEIASSQVMVSGPQAARAFAAAFADYALSKLSYKRDFLQRGYHKRLPLPNAGWLKKQVASIMEGASSLDEVSRDKQRALEDLLDYSSYVGEKTMQKLEVLASRRRHNKKPPARRHGFKKKAKYDRRSNW